MEPLAKMMADITAQAKKQIKDKVNLDAITSAIRIAASQGESHKVIRLEGVNTRTRTQSLYIKQALKDMGFTVTISEHAQALCAHYILIHVSWVY